MNNKITVAILYGWAEGPAHGRLLRQELIKNGFRITKNTAEAAVIIAHSGGGFLVPIKNKAKLIILVGLPHWPGRRLTKAVMLKLKKEHKATINFINKTLLNFYYMIFRYSAKKLVTQAYKTQSLPRLKSNVILLRNFEDSFLHPKEIRSLASRLGGHSLELPGTHDDIWENPKPYVEVIKKALAKS